MFLLGFPQHIVLKVLEDAFVPVRRARFDLSIHNSLSLSILLVYSQGRRSGPIITASWFEERSSLVSLGSPPNTSQPMAVWLPWSHRVSLPAKATQASKTSSPVKTLQSNLKLAGWQHWHG